MLAFRAKITHGQGASLVALCTYIRIRSIMQRAAMCIIYYGWQLSIQHVRSSTMILDIPVCTHYIFEFKPNISAEHSACARCQAIRRACGNFNAIHRFGIPSHADEAALNAAGMRFRRRWLSEDHHGSLKAIKGRVGWLTLEIALPRGGKGIVQCRQGVANSHCPDQNMRKVLGEHAFLDCRGST